MSDDSKRRRGRPALHQNGGSLLVRAPSKPGDELQGGWSREQLIQMDDRYVVAVEAAIRLGLENRASASACERRGRSRQAVASELITRAGAADHLYISRMLSSIGAAERGASLPRHHAFMISPRTALALSV
jgi:hypothetical protein